MAKLCVTHSGSFHADDVVAAVLLKLAGELDEYSAVVRSRSADDFVRGDIVFDVGGEYDPARGRYDHHQRGQSGQFWEDGTPLSSAGLIWQQYGEVICPHAFMRDYILDMWIRPVDADDNGTLRDVPANCRHVSTIIGELNPCWNDPAADVDAAYAQACEIVEPLLRASLKRAAAAMDAHEHVAAAIKKCAGDEVLVMDSFCPWKGSFHALEAQYAPGQKFKFAIYPADEAQSSWKIYQIPVAKGSFEGRADLPEPWGGLREDELRKISGIADARFVHPNLFCGAADSFEGAMAMVQVALKQLF